MRCSPTYLCKHMKAAIPLFTRVAASFYLFGLSKSGLYQLDRVVSITNRAYFKKKVAKIIVIIFHDSLSAGTVNFAGDKIQLSPSMPLAPFYPVT
jgi:hypothetical protein